MVCWVRFEGPISFENRLVVDVYSYRNASEKVMSFRAKAHGT